MRYLLASACFLFLLALPAKAQFVPDCSNCSQAEWGSEYNPATGGCAANAAVGCNRNQGCNCFMGFYRGYGLSVKPDFFGGAFVRDAKGAIIGFRIDRPGPLAVNHVKAGDIAYLINGHKPNRNQFGTVKRPIRRMEATWGDDGRLRLRLWR